MNVHPNARTTPRSRQLLVERVLHERWTYAEAADAAGVSTRTVAKWVARFRDEGLAGLLDRSSAPRHSPRRTAPQIVRRIETLRRRRWIAERIAHALNLACSTVCRILRRLGLARLSDLDPAPTPVRYEREHPGELIHIDTKKLGRIGRIGPRITGNRRDQSRGIGWEFVHVCVDDATRLAYVEVLPDERRQSVLPFLRRAVGWFARRGIRVRQVMTDNGAAYGSRDHAQLCDELQLQHLRTRPYTPRTNGKAERFIQTLLREWAYARPYRSSRVRQHALKDWLLHYNHRRPHRGIGRLTPAERLSRLRRTTSS